MKKYKAVKNTSALYIDFNNEEVYMTIEHAVNELNSYFKKQDLDLEAVKAISRKGNKIIKIEIFIIIKPLDSDWLYKISFYNYFPPDIDVNAHRIIPVTMFVNLMSDNVKDIINICKKYCNQIKELNMKQQYRKTTQIGKVTYLDKIKFQSGTVEKNGVNGYQIEDLLMIALNRTSDMDAKAPFDENKHTIKSIERAIKSQKHRTKRRVGQQKESSINAKNRIINLGNDEYQMVKDINMLTTEDYFNDGNDFSDKEKINSDWDKVNNDFFKQFK